MAGNGRPTLYSDEIVKEIAESMSEGITLAEICRRDHMPCRGTIYKWMEEYSHLNQLFERAREAGYDQIADEALKIADTPIDGEEVTTDSDGKIITKVGDMLGHRKLQIETRLKLLAKWHPKKYGDKIQTEHSGTIGNDPLAVHFVPPPAVDE